MHCCLINLLNYYSNDIIPLLEIHSWLFTVYGNNQNFLTLVLTVCSHNSLSILISYYSPTFMSLFLFSSSQQDTCSPETPCTKPVYTSLSIHEWSLWHHSPVLFLISLKFYFSMNIFFFFFRSSSLPDGVFLLQIFTVLWRCLMVINNFMSWLFILYLFPYTWR